MAIRPRLCLLLLASACAGAVLGCDDGVFEPTQIATISLVATDSTLSVGDSVRVSATAKNAAGDPVPLSGLIWSSSDPAIIAVNRGLVLALAPGEATVTASAAGKAGSTQVKVNGKVGSVTVTPNPALVSVGGATQLTATVKDSRGNVLTGRAVTWTTSASGIATVSSAGLVSGIAAGQATITATAAGKSGSTQVTVSIVPVATVTVSPNPSTVQVGSTVQLSTTLKDADGNVLTGRGVTWSSNNSGVATVSATGLVRGIAAGSATITATSEGKSGGSALTVSAAPLAPVASVTVSPDPAGVVVGATVQLTATLKDAGGNVLTGRAVTWSSSNTSVATVSPSGDVTGVAAGTATITAASEGRSGGASLTVSPVPVATVTVTPNPASVQTGATVQLTATLKDADGNVLSGRTVTWSSNATSKATVSTSGLVTGVAVGSATITASSGGKSGSATVNVTAVPVATVTVSPNPASVNVGATVQLTATLKDANGNVLTGRAVTWSSNSANATVSSTGVVTGQAAGSATITATSEGKSGSSAVIVNSTGGGGASTVSVTPGAPNIPATGSLQLSATVKDANGNVLTGAPVTWTSSNPLKVSVSTAGRITAGTDTVLSSESASAVITATSGSASGTAQVTVSLAPGPHTDIDYCDFLEIYRQMDVYEPSASFPRPLPVAIFIHGGGWTSGDKTDAGWHFGQVRDTLLNHGYLVVNLNYRLSTATSNKWPVPEQDVRCAVRQLRGNARVYGADPNRFGAWGTSAGATLAALLDLAAAAQDPISDGDVHFLSFSSQVRAYASMDGVSDLTRPSQLADNSNDVFTSTDTTDGSQRWIASPIHNISPDDGPGLLFHGTADVVVDPVQSQNMCAALGSARCPGSISGIPSGVQVVQNGDHGLEPSPAGTTISPTREEIAHRIRLFFDAMVAAGP
ncbi:MAG TPA: Ig-like domain-containing protein [Gemmatimonadales bacterium]|nr:Ig-like domain-containing protein [Gemmatimonadales bacterium]